MTQQPPTARLRPVIRVFVSSTFSDLKHERDALQRDVFPRLEQLCAGRQFQFQAIDLRWGISSEAGDDHRTMRICFDELRRSQEVSPEPNFLILLGNRYGMRPLPEEISQAEYDQLTAAAQYGGEHRAPLPGAHGKTALQVLRDWYRCDENVLLPVPLETEPDHAPLNYVLQPRTQDLHDGRDYTRTNQKNRTYSQDWRDVQQVLRRIIDVAFPVESLDHRFDHIDWPYNVASVNDTRDARRAVPQIVRFQGSATEQEIWHGALSAPNAERHVLAFFRDIANRDDFAPEEARDFFDLTETRAFDEVAAKRQNALRKAIGDRLGQDATWHVPYSRLKRANGKVMVDASEADTQALCDAVFKRLRPIVEHQIEAYWRDSAQASVDRAARELEIEQSEYERFAQERGGEESFVGRQVELQAILVYVGNDSPWPLVIHGASGCGKTALMARASQEVAKTRKRIERFIGVAPRSSDLRSLLGSLCQELRQRNPRADALPTEIEQLRDEFAQHLQAATAEQPLILLLDALDQLADADNGRLLNWLPLGSLPAHVKLVVSCLSDRDDGDPAGKPYAELKRRPIPAEHFVNLDVLSEAEARLLLFDRWLPKAGRTVSDDQRARIERRLAAPPGRQPIYLKLLFEEIRLWHSYDPAPVLGESVPALLGQLFDRLSKPTNHGPLLVNRVLGYLSASRYGLAENETLEILFADPEYKAKLNEPAAQTRHELPPNAKRIPIALWSRLRIDLAPYLTERAAPGANVLTFYHRQVADWVQQHFAEAPDPRRRPHQLLAVYFRTRSDPAGNRTWQGESARPFLELPFHLAQADPESLRELLFDFHWLQAKVTKTSVYEILRDYDNLLGMFRRGHAHRAALTLVADALRQAVHAVTDDATQLGSQMAGRLRSADDSRVKSMLEQIRRSDAAPHLLPLSPSLIPAGALETGVLCQSSNHCTAIAFAPDSRSIVTGTTDGEINVWDIATRTLQNSLQGHQAPVNSLAVSRSGKLVLSGSGRPRATLEPDSSTRFVEQLAAVLPGNLSELDSILGDMAPVWKATLLEALAGQRTTAATSHSISSQVLREVLAGGSSDNSVRLWNLEKQIELAVLEGHRSAVTHVAISPDARYAASASEDHDICLWDLHQRCLYGRLQGYDDEIVDIRFNSDDPQPSLLVATPSRSDLVKIESGQCLPLGPWTVGLSPNQMQATQARWTAQDRMFMQNRTLLTVINREYALIQKASPNGNYWNLRIEPKLDVNLLFHRAKYRILMSHQGPVRRLALDRNGRRCISASADGQIKVCDIDLDTGGERGTLPGLFGTPRALAISDDGCRGASSGQDGAVRLWNLDAVAPLGVPDRPTDLPRVSLQDQPISLTLGRECNSAAALLQNGMIAVIDVSSLRIVRRLDVSEMDASQIVLSEAIGIVVCGGRNGTVACLDTTDGRVVWKASIHSSDVSALAISPDGSRVVSAATDGTIALTDTATGEVLQRAHDHTAPVTALMIATNKDLVVSGSDDQNVVTWMPSLNKSITHHLTTVESNSPDLPWLRVLAIAPLQIRILLAMPTPFANQQDLKVWDLAHTKLLNPLAFQVAPVTAAAAACDGDFGIVALEDGSLKVWQLEKLDLIASNTQRNGRVTAAAIGSGADVAILATSEPAVRLWNIGHAALREQSTHSDDVNGVAFVPHAGYIVSASYDRTLKVWNEKTLELVRTLRGHKRSVTSVVVVPNTSTVLSVSNDGDMILWDLARFREIRSFRHTGARCLSADISGDGTFVSCWDDAKVRFFDLASGEYLRELSKEIPTARIVVLHPYQASVFVGCESGSICQFDLATGNELACFRETGDPVYCLAVDLEGTCLVSGTTGQTVTIWDVAARNVEKVLTGHRGCVFGVAMDPSGRLIASGSEDGRVKLWERRSGALLATFTTDHPIYCVAFTEQGHGIVAGNGGGVGTLHFLNVML